MTLLYLAIGLGAGILSGLFGIGGGRMSFNFSFNSAVRALAFRHFG